MSFSAFFIENLLDKWYHLVPYIYYSYGYYTALLKDWNFPASLTPFMAGGLAANTFFCAAFPFDVVRNRMMNVQPRFDSMRSCIYHVYRIEGWRGFYKGFSPAIIRSFPTNGAALLVMEYVSTLAKDLNRHNL
jgi:solute carrier family 25 carnitine/acylcarnitine transporter 20/29